ncbi:MAG: S-methyl-5'-thioadenosine phosphorylase [Parvularculaceae bacterium]
MGGKRVLGVIGGSGLYAFETLGAPQSVELTTPWGPPSGPLIKGRLGGVDVVFLARHGAGHRLPPSEVNYRANIDALKRVGVTDVVSISACGSLREEIKPGDFVVVDQYADRTSGRARSFFGTGFVAHVSMADPVCPALARALSQACGDAGAPFHERGTYVCIDGPQFSSRAESDSFRREGFDVIGMTNMPEAKLAREAELPYASLAMVTDYDCWRRGEKPVEVADVLAVMKSNTERAKALLPKLAAILGPTRAPSPIDRTLDFSVITAPEARDPALAAKLDAVAGRYLAQR